MVRAQTSHDLLSATSQCLLGRELSPRCLLLLQARCAVLVWRSCRVLFVRAWPNRPYAACAEQVRIDHVLGPRYATPLLGPRPLYHFYFAWRAQIGVLLPQSRPLKSEAFPPSDRPCMYGTDCESSDRIITAQRMNGYINDNDKVGVM